MNICGKFHWNPPTKWRDIASREIAAGWPAGRTTEKHNTSATLFALICSIVTDMHATHVV